ncbi:MAG: hypothetical protein RIR00_307 [Pseudomonadota bacterium]
MKEQLPKLRVLAVDDNRTNLHILQVFLNKLGHSVILAENGLEAVDRFVNLKPDLILLDIMMPVMDGFQAARQIKAHSSERWVPIIFLSALNRDENLVEGLEAGGDDYLTKPINFVVLEAKMRSMQRALHLQQSALEALKRIQAISDNVLEAIITIDCQANIVACNNAAERIFGWSPEKLIGQNVNMLMPEPYRGEHDGYVRNFVMGGPPGVMGLEREVVGQRRDGSTFPAELGVTEIRLNEQRHFIGMVRDISERKRSEHQLLENAELLQKYYDQTQAEQQLAKRLMEKQLHRAGLRDPSLHYWLAPAQNFSGDVVAASRSPDGRLYALLADATGHGLAAAISVLPTLAIFYRMVSQNRTASEILHELNQQLLESMPVGRFVAATLVCLEQDSNRGEIWIGGTPEALLLDPTGTPITRFTPSHLPLGIVSNAELDTTLEKFSWNPGEQLLMFSDGLLEAENPDGQQFGSEGLLKAIAGTSAQQRFDIIRDELTRHLAGQLAADDVSLLLLDCA